MLPFLTFGMGKLEAGRKRACNLELVIDYFSGLD
jgi:hypothetical protein